MLYLSSFIENNVMKIMHIITGLGTGGAETMLYKLACQGEPEDVVIVSLQDEGTLGQKFKDQGIEVRALKVNKNPFKALLNLIKMVLKSKPDIIQGWMYHGNLIASFVKTVTVGKIPAIWNIRQCLYDIKNEKRTTQYVIKLNAWLSHTSLVDKIVFNSNLSMEQHKKIGFNSKKFVYIPNGFVEEEATVVAPVSLKEEFSLKPETILIGHVGRYHVVKGHQYLIEAAGIIKKQYGDKVHFVCIGHGVKENAILEKLAQENDVSDIFHFMDEQKQISAFMKQFDIFVLPSLAEAFPNVLGEAMLAERVCVASDVGDVSAVLGNHGILVPPADSQNLADGIINVLKKSHEEREVVGKLARKSILNHFSIEKIFEQYEILYKGLCKFLIK